MLACCGFLTRAGRHTDFSNTGRVPSDILPKQKQMDFKEFACNVKNLDFYKGVYKRIEEKGFPVVDRKVVQASYAQDLVRRFRSMTVEQLEGYVNKMLETELRYKSRKEVVKGMKMHMRRCLTTVSSYIFAD
jgi:hypothetical protein